MSNPIPSSLALTNIPTGSQILSSTHDTNYAAIQSAVNEIITALNTGTNGQVLQSAGGAAVQWAASTTTYRKTTAKQVVNTVTETDLLNGEITVAAGAMGTTGVLRLTAEGDWIQNAGVATDAPRLKLKLGATTLIDTGVFGSTAVTAGAGRYHWEVEAVIRNLGVANSQWCKYNDLWVTNDAGATQAAFTTGEGRRWTIEHVSTSHSVAFQGAGGNSGAVDTTASQALVLSVINPTASASMDVTLKGALVEII